MLELVYILSAAEGFVWASPECCKSFQQQSRLELVMKKEKRCKFGIDCRCALLGYHMESGIVRELREQKGVLASVEHYLSLCIFFVNFLWKLYILYE